jgi:hypothetical protein
MTRAESAEALKKGELNVVIKAKEICEYVFASTQKSPVKFRWSLVKRLQSLSLKALSALYSANDLPLVSTLPAGNAHAEVHSSPFADPFASARAINQTKAIAALRKLDFFAELSLKEKCITPGQHEHLSKLILDGLRMTCKWRASDVERAKRRLA